MFSRVRWRHSRPPHWSLRTRMLAMLIAIALPSALMTVRSVQAALPDHEWANVLVTGLLIALAWTMSDRLVLRPLASIAEIAERQANGERGLRSPVPTVRELADVAVAYNRMADAMEESEEDFAALADRSPDGVLRVAVSGEVLFGNPAAERILGSTPGPLTGQRLQDVAPEAIAQAWIALTTRALATGDVGTQDVVVPALPAVPTRTIELRVVPERELGEVLADRVLVALRDVTAARATEAALRQSQKLESVGLLAGGIAHDFNNLLAGIVGHAELALEELDEQHPAHADVAALRDAVIRSTGLTRQLLTFARKHTPSVEPVAIPDVVEQLAPLFTRLLGAEVTLRCDIAPNLPCVDADAGQLEQVLMNLAVNARDAMPRGGHITLGVRLAEVDEGQAARLSLPTTGTYVVVEVADTGIGMSPEVLAHAFEPFYTTKAPGKGTGLGLATCFGILRQHQGAIAVTSTLGLGTKFSLYLPASTLAPTTTKPHESAWLGETMAGHEHLLVVEDDATIRGLLTRTLTARGYSVTAVEDGEAALAAMTAVGGASIDAVVTDLVMPRLSAPGLVTQLHRMTPGLPIVLMTGNPDRLHEMDGMDVSTIAKPFTAVQLLYALRQAIDTSAPSLAA